MSEIGRFELVDQLYLPRTVLIPRVDGKLLWEAHSEIWLRAAGDPNGCWGYYPHDPRADNNELFKARDYYYLFPTIEVEDKEFDFNFLRVALRPQAALRGLHIDRSVATGIGKSKNLIWRLLINLGTKPRQLTYSEQNPENLPMIEGDDFMTASEISQRYIKQASLEPINRGKGKSKALLFCASKVLHGGSEDEDGHAIMSYGCEQRL
jgi:hypothetical protein